MNEFDVKRDKTKAFKASADTIEKVDELIKKSGKGPTEFFEELVTDLSISSIVDPSNDSISPDLRKHFESDVTKLKNATNSIFSIFTSQMQNIAVEKNQWQTISTKQLGEKQEELEKLNTEHEELKQKFDESKLGLTELTKVNESTQKELDVLSKRTEDQEQLIQDRNEKVSDLQERINTLNENIVSKDEQLKAVEPMKKELVVSKQKIDTLEEEKVRLFEKQEEEIEKLLEKHKDEKGRLLEKHEDEVRRQKENLIFTCEKEKHKVETTLKEQMTKEKEELRNEVRKQTEAAIREFYLEELKRKENQIEQLQQQVQTLSIKRTSAPRNKKEEEK